MFKSMPMFKSMRMFKSIPIYFLLLVVSSVLILATSLAVAGSPSPKNASAYFISPQDGAKVKGTFNVVFGLRNMGVAPAGVQKENTGHFHLIIDAPAPGDGKPIPNDDKHRHFGGGQTETSVTLPKGKHTLQLMLGDHAHVPHNPPVVSKKITVTVTD